MTTECLCDPQTIFFLEAFCLQQNYFGNGCKLACHCTTDCDRLTGVCGDTCVDGYFGPSCQYSKYNILWWGTFEYTLFHFQNDLSLLKLAYVVHFLNRINILEVVEEEEKEGGEK